MKVYVELVIFNNLAVDLLVIYAVLVTLGIKRGKLRMILGAALGAAVATAYPMLFGWAKTLAAVLLAPVMTAVCAKFCGIKQYLFALLLVCIYTFTMGGIVFGVKYLFSIDLTTGWVLGLMAIAAFLLLYGLRQMRLKSVSGDTEAQSYDVELVVKGQTLTAKGFYDSGNKLIDEVTARPVIVLSGQIGEQVVQLSKRTIEVQTVGGKANLPLVLFDSVTVACEQSGSKTQRGSKLRFGSKSQRKNKNGGKRTFSYLPAAISEKPNCDFDVILNCAMRL